MALHDGLGRATRLYALCNLASILGSEEFCKIVLDIATWKTANEDQHDFLRSAADVVALPLVRAV